MPRTSVILRAVVLAMLLPGTGWASPGGIALDRLPTHAFSVELPSGAPEAAPERIPIGGPWRIVSTVNGVRTWQAPLPVRLRSLHFSRPPKGMKLAQQRANARGFRTVKHLRGLNKADKSGTWEFDAHVIRVRRPIAAGPPTADEYALSYAAAAEREDSLSFDRAGLPAADFVVRSLQVEDATRHGLFLPAPSSFSTTLTVPHEGVLDLGAMLLPPEAADPLRRSDGARLTAVVSVGGAQETVMSVDLTTGDHLDRRADLSRWAGQEITLTLATDPGGSDELDYVFVENPVVFSPDPDPPRVILVFIDTLRTDHLSVYGYERETTPTIDAWAKDAAVFTEARSIAPWTLPSARTMMTGHHPEQWGAVETLQGRFAKEGWATAFMAGNFYLSSNFEAARDWGLHRCLNLPAGSTQTTRALDWLAEHDDQPAFLMLHYMDAHLPYTEPLWWRRRYAGSRPAAFASDEFHRGHVLRAYKKLDDDGVQYILDRYDNNIAYIDHLLGQLFARLGSNDTVILLADHGEEFWDHGAFEHGHTLYDEVLRVPLIAKGPGIEAGRFDMPVSLLDVAPTLAQAAGLPVEEGSFEGWPLQQAADGSRAPDFVARPQAFGRPLYGLRQWGVLQGTDKYTTAEGVDERYDLASDRAEQRDRYASGWDAAPHDAWAAMGASLDRPVCSGFRVVPTRSNSKNDLTVEIVVPGGVAWAYPGDDPYQVSSAAVTVDGERVRSTWKGGFKGTREVFIVPLEDPSEIAGQLAITSPAPTDHTTLEVGGSPPAFRGEGEALAQGKLADRTVTVGYAVVPAPPPEGSGIQASDDEASAALEALGYQEAASSEGGGSGSGTLAADAVVPPRCTW